VTTHAEVVALGDVVGEHDARVLADATEHGQQNVALQRLRFVHNHEGVMQRPSTNVSERQHLQHPALDHLIEHVLRNHRTQGVEHGLGPGIHLLRGIPGQEAELLAPDGIQRAKNHDLLVLLLLEHSLEAGAERKGGLAGTGTAPERDDSDLRIEQHVDGEALLGRAAVQSEDVAIAAHEPQPAWGGHASERRTAIGMHDETRVDGRIADQPRIQLLVVVELRHLLRTERDIRHSGPAGVDRELCAVLLRGETDRCGLDPQGKVLRDDGDIEPVIGKIESHREDARVVVVQLQTGGEHRHVRVVELDP
jgi:hypothetical protein